MDCKTALTKMIMAESSIVAVIGSRLYGGKLPQVLTGPAIIFRLYDAEDDEVLHFPGATKTMSTFRFGCVARGNNGYDVSSQLDELLSVALRGFTGLIVDDTLSPPEVLHIKGIRRIHASDFYDDPTETWWVRSDWEIHHDLT